MKVVLVRQFCEDLRTISQNPTKGLTDAKTDGRTDGRGYQMFFFYYFLNPPPLNKAVTSPTKKYDDIQGISDMDYLKLQ